MLKDKWKTIRDAIDRDIRSGVLKPGHRLPTESELVRTWGAGRHSVRRAMSELAREGKLSVEQIRTRLIGKWEHAK